MRELLSKDIDPGSLKEYQLHRETKKYIEDLASRLDAEMPKPTDAQIKELLAKFDGEFETQMEEKKLAEKKAPERPPQQQVASIIQNLPEELYEKYASRTIETEEDLTTLIKDLLRDYLNTEPYEHNEAKLAQIASIAAELRANVEF